MDDKKTKIKQYYDAVSESYGSQYDEGRLYDTETEYPANYFRLQLLLNLFLSKDIKSVVEVGMGEGTPLSELGRTGIDIWGFDNSIEMVNKAKETIKKSGLNPDQIFFGDIEDPTTYAQELKEINFDGLVAMGVMPHVRNDEVVLNNVSALVRPGGTVFVEFRNKLFSLFTFNRHTLEFILEDLLSDVSDEIKDVVRKDLESRLRTDMPIVQNKLGHTDLPGYDAILSKYHNPFEVIDLFNNQGFTDAKLHWYHYHPCMPYLQNEIKNSFREEAIKLESGLSNWRGYFLCSAFVIEATTSRFG